MSLRQRIRRPVVVLLSTLAVPAIVSAQNPPAGQGWQPSPCGRSYPLETVKFLLDDNLWYFWEVRLDLVNYITTSHANYSVFPQGQYIESEPTGGKIALWINGAVDMYCWEQHVVYNGVPVTNYLRQQGVYRDGNFEFKKDDQMCDEFGNIVDYGGTPCENTPTGANSGNDFNGEDCQFEYVTVQEDYGYGWQDVWSGDVLVCTT